MTEPIVVLGTTPETAMSNEPETLVRRLIDAINAQDYEALHDLIHPDYVYRTPGQELRGVAGLVGLLTAYHQGFPDLELVINDVFGDGNRVATAFTFQGTHLGELMGVPATGQTVSVHGTIHGRVRDGKIVEEWELIDLLTMFQQLGLAETGTSAGCRSGDHDDDSACDDPTA